MLWSTFEGQREMIHRRQSAVCSPPLGKLDFAKNQFCLKEQPLRLFNHRVRLLEAVFHLKLKSSRVYLYADKEGRGPAPCIRPREVADPVVAIVGPQARAHGLGRGRHFPQARDRSPCCLRLSQR
jgi:hypothetical protein